MSQVEGDGEPGTEHELLLRFGLFVNDHRGWLLLFTGCLLPGAAAFLSVVGQDLDDGGDFAYVGGAVAVIVVGGLLQMLSSWAARKSSELDLVEADRLRVTLKDALQPVAEMIADMELLGRRPDRVAMLKSVAAQAVGALKLIFADIDRARATVYQLTPDGDLECIIYQGRGEGVQPQPFERQTPRGEQALAMVRSDQDMLIVDIDTVETASDGKVISPDYRGSRSGYKTFISCSITNKDKPYGMVTLDAPHPGDLSDTDKQLVGLMADLLAIAFAIEERGSRSPKVGEAAGKGIE
ncbi:GAF domain-containing protein [Mycolicibacterium houstonense]|uniref:GAF domain-containing protein n=1 Tax=Mycolicibacterium houstonense TaxID=146021 RepID=UPI003F9A37E5